MGQSPVLPSSSTGGRRKTEYTPKTFPALLYRASGGMLLRQVQKKDRRSDLRGDTTGHRGRSRKLVVMTTPITVSSPAAAKAIRASIVPCIGGRFSGAVTSTASAMPGDQPEDSP